MRNIARFLVVIVTSLLLVAGSVSHASADSASLERNLFLTYAPRPSDATARMARSIFLAAGTYDWRVVTGNESTVAAFDSRRLFLASGTYTWACDIVPQSGTYRNVCSLSRPGFATAWLVSSDYKIFKSDFYNFQSVLAR